MFLQELSKYEEIIKTKDMELFCFGFFLKNLDKWGHNFLFTGKHLLSVDL